MNPPLLTEVFFEIRHSTNHAEYADITPAALGVRELRKLFFVSCNYHDPEHVIIRTYSKLNDFNWNDQRSINDLNLFREAAIMEACGAVTFGAIGDPLDADKIESTIDEGSNERSAKRQKISSTIGVSHEGMHNGGEGSARAATQGGAMLANPAVGSIHLQLTAAKSKPQTPKVPFDMSHLKFQTSLGLAAQLQQSGYQLIQAEDPHFAAPQQHRQESTIQYDANHQNPHGGYYDQQGTITTTFGSEATLNTTQTKDPDQLQSGANTQAPDNGTASQSPSDNTTDEGLANFLAD
ncbi:hypothetical protein DID88_002531 [Monilinia fructigena]|uniref:Uncharacterized protein n=1 Tax=Monilinia fructigena TaxID=38457 RepID=A0A395IQ72_9HELO|nr:hypothetical protein DID88_002531 [Monilinia fructigena]